MSLDSCCPCCGGAMTTAGCLNPRCNNKAYNFILPANHWCIPTVLCQEAGEIEKLMAQLAAMTKERDEARIVVDQLQKGFNTQSDRVAELEKALKKTSDEANHYLTELTAMTKECDREALIAKQRHETIKRQDTRIAELKKVAQAIVDWDAAGTDTSIKHLTRMQIVTIAKAALEDGK